jgi:hypothetical protein
MTAVNDHEAVILFGKRGLTQQEKERVLRVGQERAENAGGVGAGGLLAQTLARLVGQNDELNAIWDAQPLNGYCPDAYILDVDTWTYTKLEPEWVPPALRKGHTACLHPDGKSVLVFGGVLSSKEVFEDVDEECTISDDLHVLAQEWRDGKRVWVWRELETEGEAPHKQQGHGACIVGDRMVVLAGYTDKECIVDGRTMRSQKDSTDFVKVRASLVEQHSQSSSCFSFGVPFTSPLRQLSLTLCAASSLQSVSWSCDESQADFDGPVILKGPEIRFWLVDSSLRTRSVPLLLTRVRFFNYKPGSKRLS